MKIDFLPRHVHDTGRTIRTDLAAVAAERGEEVEVASGLHCRDRPAVDDSRIRLVSLAGYRKSTGFRQACPAAGPQARKQAGRLGRGHSW